MDQDRQSNNFQFHSGISGRNFSSCQATPRVNLVSMRSFHFALLPSKLRRRRRRRRASAQPVYSKVFKWQNPTKNDDQLTKFGGVQDRGIHRVEVTPSRTKLPGRTRLLICTISHEPDHTRPTTEGTFAQTTGALPLPPPPARGHPCPLFCSRASKTKILGAHLRHFPYSLKPYPDSL